MKMGKSGWERCIGWVRKVLRKKENSKTERSWKPSEEKRRRHEGIRDILDLSGSGQDGIEADYDTYRLNLRQFLGALGGGAGIAGAAAYTFYRSMGAFLILLIPAAVSPLYFREYWKKKRLHQLELQFKEAIQLLSAALSAGYSVENAIAACQKELEMMYGKEGMICREFAYMRQQMEMNRTVEELMGDFGRRSGLAEIENFARIFAIAKRSGGQLVPIIRHTVQIMEDRFRVKEEIRVLTASKQFEQRLMNLMPFLIILYIDGTSPGFFKSMYTTVMGRIVMTACLGVYLLSVYLSGKILDIPIS